MPAITDGLRRKMDEFQAESSSHTIETGSIKPTREACVACRKTKIRCKPVSEDSPAQAVCQRCTRLKIECIYKQLKRGRKAKNPEEVLKKVDIEQQLRENGAYDVFPVSFLAQSSMSTQLPQPPPQSQTALSDDDSDYYKQEKKRARMSVVDPYPSQHSQQHLPPQPKRQISSHSLSSSTNGYHHLHSSSVNPNVSPSNGSLNQVSPPVDSSSSVGEVGNTGEPVTVGHPLFTALMEPRSSRLSPGASTSKLVEGSIQSVEELMQQTQPDYRRVNSSSISLAKVLKPRHHEGSKRRKSGAEEDEHEVDESLVGKSSLMWEEMDPVRLGLVSRGNVLDLFDFYHEKLNPFIGLLDILLHTPEYVQRTSPILFTALLTVSSKLSMPNLYAPLLHLSQKYLGQAFAEGQSSLGLIQALSVLCMWKDARDTMSFKRIGYAIRMAYELGLNEPPKRPLPETEFQAREVLNRERTWLQLCHFDATLHMQQNGRPRMIAQSAVFDCDIWMRDHPQFPCFSDAMLSASLHSLLYIELGGSMVNSRDVTMRKMILDRVEVANSRWKNFWLDPPDKSGLTLHPISRSVLFFYHKMTDVGCAELRLGTALLENHDQRSQQSQKETMVAFMGVIKCCMEILSYISQQMAPSGFLTYSQDVVAFCAVRSALLLAKNMKAMDGALQTRVHDSLASFAQACEIASNQPKDNLSYLAAFFHSLLQASESQAPTRPGSRATSPHSEEQIIPNTVSDQSNGLNAFLFSSGNDWNGIEGFQAGDGNDTIEETMRGFENWWPGLNLPLVDNTNNQDFDSFLSIANFEV